MSRWPMVPLGEVLERSNEWTAIEPDTRYKEITVRLWGHGVVLRREAFGSEIKTRKRSVVRHNQFILSRIDARNGAFGIVPEELDGAIATGDFPAYEVRRERLLPRFLEWLSRTASFVDLCRAASEGTTNRVRLKEGRFLATAIPLPDPPKQLQIIRWIDTLAVRVEEANRESKETEKRLDSLLMSAFHQIADNAPRRPLREVAPLTRRPAAIDPNADYPGISARSFGRGTFRNPPLLGSEITWQKPYEVKAGDILVSNIKAWEGAIAVVKPEDDGCFGSHRYLTFVPIADVATSRFICFYLLSPEGLYHVGEASPGSADRNRTTGSRAMQEIPVPVPSIDQQEWFDELHAKVENVRQIRASVAAEQAAMRPSVLNEILSGG